MEQQNWNTPFTEGCRVSRVLCPGAPRLLVERRTLLKKSKSHHCPGGGIEEFLGARHRAQSCRSLAICRAHRFLVDTFRL